MRSGHMPSHRNHAVNRLSPSTDSHRNGGPLSERNPRGNPYSWKVASGGCHTCE